MIAMLVVFALSPLQALSPQQPGDALELGRQGRFNEAAAAFRSAVDRSPHSPELLYDLAVTAWRAGDLPGAEDAIERYAAAPGGGRADLHHGMLGNLRYAEAEALGQQAEAPPAPVMVPPPGAGVPPGNDPTQPQPAEPPAPPDPVALLEQAVDKATKARDEYLRAAAAPEARAEIARNTERALKLLADLQKKLEDAKKQRDEQKKKNDKSDKKDKDQENKDDKDKKDDEKKDDEKKPEDQKKQDDKKDQDKKDDQKQDQKQDQQKQDEQKPGEEKPQPQQQQGDPDKQDDKKNEKQDPQNQQQNQPQDQQKDGEQKPEPKPGEEDKDKPKGAESSPSARDDAPGEQQEGKELSPEQVMRLLQELKDLDDKLKQVRARARLGRKPVERDW